MNTIILKNANILDIENNTTNLSTIYIKDGLINKIVSNTDIDGLKALENSLKFKNIETIDCENNIIMPSFKNAHSHTPMSLFRSSAENETLLNWLYKIVFPAESKLIPEDVYWGTALSIAEMVRNGITATYDMYFYLDELTRAFIEAGLKVCISSSTNGNDVDAAIHRLESEYEKFNNISPLVKLYAGCHAEYTASKEVLQKLSEFVNVNKIPFYTHMSESAQEVKECYDRYKLSPAELFEKLGLWNYGGGVYHAVHMSDRDIKILKAHNISISTNPCCNSKIASGVAPIKKYMDNGLLIGLGTDGQGSNNSMSMFKEMYMLIASQRVTLDDPKVISAKDAINFATKGSAAVMRLNNCLDLSEGSDADLIMIDKNSPAMHPQNYVENLVFAGGNELILMTMSLGKVLYYKGEYKLPWTLSEIFKNIEKIKKKIFL